MIDALFQHLESLLRRLKRCGVATALTSAGKKAFRKLRGFHTNRNSEEDLRAHAKENAPKPFFL